MVYSQLVFINKGLAEVLVILVQDFYLLNLSKKNLVNLSNKYECILIVWPSSPSVLDKWKP